MARKKQKEIPFGEPPAKEPPKVNYRKQFFDILYKGSNEDSKQKD